MRLTGPAADTDHYPVARERSDAPDAAVRETNAVCQPDRGTGRCLSGMLPRQNDVVTTQ
jgi:hypothetical protein